MSLKLGLKVVPARTNQMDALKQVIGDGNRRTLPDIQASIERITGKVPTTGSLNVLLSNLRTKSGYRIEVTRGKRGEHSIYQLVGATGRIRKRKSA